MGDLPAESDNPLLAALRELNSCVNREALQPLNQLAEEALVVWTRVMDGQEVVQPRLNGQGHAATGFHFGMEEISDNRLDRCDLGKGQEGFDPALQSRLDGLRERLEVFFAQSGYRSSGEQCDQVMLELSRASRFLNVWSGEGERMNRNRPRYPDPAPSHPPNKYDTSTNDTSKDDISHEDKPARGELLGTVRRQFAIWEPFFNAAIVAWDENHLDNFTRALTQLLEALRQPPQTRMSLLPPPGFPLRRLGCPRQKFTVYEPEQRPLRSRSVFGVRSHQLEERIRSNLSISDTVLDALRQDVIHFTAMVESNHFMLASQPGFLRRAKAGVPTIRNQSKTHPYLLDPNGLFKKAVLFQNRTYSREGGGLDLMFLQCRQLERLARFDGWGDWTRPLRAPLERVSIAWEENRWDAFTEALVEVAGFIRRQAGG